MRLTERDGDKVWFAQGRPRGFLCPRDFCDNAYGCDKVKDRTCPYLRLLDKLAAYEDAEEQGRLIILPCKVGDSVFILTNGHIYEVKICEIMEPEIRTKDLDGRRDIDFYPKNLGWYLFLSREEAEAALKKEAADNGV